MPSRRFRRLTFLVAASLAAGGCAQRAGTEALPSATPSAERAPRPPASAASTASARAELGRGLYQRYCQLCHAPDGSGYAADNAPSLVTRSFLESASDAFIASGIRMGRPGTAMAAYGKSRGGPLDEPQIAAIVAFLRLNGPAPVALPRAPLTGDAARGASLFERECRSCHGTATARESAPHLHNPELLASAAPEFLRHAIVHGRPPTPMPAFESKLAPAEIEDLLAFLQSLKPSQPAAAVKDTQIPDNLPVVINPHGKAPQFTLREGRFVSADQVKRALEQKRRIVIVDARSPADWIQFRIPGAISLAYHDKDQLDRIPNDGTWVVAYCACPHHASGEVVDQLRKRNYPNTAVLDEGILVWRDRGYALVGEAAGKPLPKSTPAVGSGATGLPKLPPPPAPRLAPAPKASSAAPAPALKPAPSP